MKVLVTGGTGYIGSHACVDLIETGHSVLIVDNLCNSTADVAENIGRITGTVPGLEVADILDMPRMLGIVRDWRPDAVMHFAALKSVATSCREPLRYFHNNVTGTINVLAAARDVGVDHFVFSSSATVYGDPDACPVREDAPLRVKNPYGRTKLVMEQMIEDVAEHTPGFKAAILRYFNPAGAHPSGLIGESPRGEPDNLMPYVAQVAAGKLAALRIFGDDYPTRDGTGVRDYIHVMDLARAHTLALDYLAREKRALKVNLGTGSGYSVREVVAAFERASDRPVVSTILPRRNGDSAECYADPALAAELLHWRAAYSLDQMCRDAWRWQSIHTEIEDPPS
jgi:UDP-glucose 4-epimerase